MLSIHLKIEAKNSINLDLVCKVLNYSRVQSIQAVYKTFNKDCFLLPYKVQKLSKRARRGLI
jgi:hypothetical protein